MVEKQQGLNIERVHLENLPSISELQSVRNFVGQTEEQRRALENKVKERYVISDWNSKNGMGYLIHDNQKNRDDYFSFNSRLTLENRYLDKDNQRNVIENALDLFARVAVNVAEADLKYDPKKDITSTAEGFLESLVHQEFMPNTPTLCNAGRSLQQLSACFVLPIEDYMATDDIGEDPEKQGNGIYDTLRYMAMIHKSGGGTGFNFSHLRPRSDRISTTFGSSSGPVSFAGVFDASTNAVNQGGFRRGANMGILNYTHPDIFEFISEKARNQSMKNFNLSVGVDEEFMNLIKNDGYFRLINPKEENTKPIRERIWKEENLLLKGSLDYKKYFNELEPSLIINEDKISVINTYNENTVGKVDEDGSILISARSIFDEIAHYAWVEGCPGIIFLNRLEENNPTSHIEKIEATNPCGEQPLPDFGACNLGGINVATCVEDGKINYRKLEKKVHMGIHFLDNVIDMSKFPFQKIYGKVHGSRRIGLGIMGWAEMLVQLNIAYDSNEAIELAGDISSYITKTARTKSQELAEERGVFPYWEGSVYEEQGIKMRNATVTTIAPNGTTGMINDVNGGIEPYWRLSYKKTCMDGKKLMYRPELLIKELGKRFKGKNLEKILGQIDKTGSIQDIEEIPEELKRIFKTTFEIAPEWHVKMQAAFQIGKDGVGVDNAVSKTVNLPPETSVDCIKKIYQMAYDEGCMGITVFREGSKTGVYSGLETTIELIQNSVELDPRLEKKAQAIKYKVKRLHNKDSLHIIPTSDLYVDDENEKAYFIPNEIFQERVPLGHATTVSFSQAGMDRTEILRGPNPDYTELIRRLQSPSSNEEEGIGPMKIKSIEHAVGLVLEDYLLRNGIIGYDKESNKLLNLISKEKLRKVEMDSDEFKGLISQVRVKESDEELRIMGNYGKPGQKFVCDNCVGEDYLFEAGCNHPKCKNCGEIKGGNCG